MFAAALPAIIDQLADTSFRETFPKLLSMARSTCRRTASARVVAIAVAVEEKKTRMIQLIRCSGMCSVLKLPGNLVFSAS